MSSQKGDAPAIVFLAEMYRRVIIKSALECRNWEITDNDL